VIAVVDISGGDDDGYAPRSHLLDIIQRFPTQELVLIYITIENC